MQKLSGLLAKVFFVFSVGITSANANSIKDEDVHRYLVLSGSKSALQSIPAQIDSMSQQMQITSKDPAESQKVMASLSAAWQEIDIEKVVVEHLKNSYSNEELTRLLTWLETDLARRVKAAEEKSTATNFNQEFMQYMANIQTAPPSPERVQAVRNFIESTTLVDHTMKMVMSIATGVSKSLQSVDSNEISDEQINAQITQMETMMKPQLEQQLILVSYYIYDELSDADINEYASFYQKPLGQKELDVTSDAFGKAFSQWTVNAVNAIESE